MQLTNLKVASILFLVATAVAMSSAYSNTEISKTRDCTEIELQAVIDQNVSREENLERLSQQFFQSVNTIESCDRKLESNNDNLSTTDTPESSMNGDIGTSSSENDASSIAASSDATTKTSADAINNSSPSSNMTASGSLVGTNFDLNLNGSEQSSTSDIVGTTPQAEQADTGTIEAATDEAQQDQILTNGKTPDDIPDENNDSILEAQIRAAAMAETDPKTQKNLWNEYRRYKGLPERN